MNGITKEQLETYQDIMSKIFGITAERPIEGFRIDFFQKGKSPTMTITWHDVSYEEQKP